LCLMEDDDDAKLEAKKEWEKGRRELEGRESAKRRRLALEVTAKPASSTSKLPQSRPMLSLGTGSKRDSPNSVVTSLRARILENTARQSDPFAKAQKPLKPRLITQK